MPDRFTESASDQPAIRARRPGSWNPGEKLGEPGGLPLHARVYPSMYTGRPWTMRSTPDSAPPQSPTRATSS